MSKRKVAPAKKKDFDPQGSYGWQPEDEFVLNGNQFGFIFNIFHKLVITAEPVPAKVLVEAHTAMLEIIKTGFDQGIVTERPSPSAIPPDQS